QLYKLTSDLSHQYRVYLPKKNNAAIYDEYWIQPGKEKRSLQSIKALLLEDAGFRMQFSTSPTKSALNKSSSRGIASLCGPEANVPGESFCPPDNTYEPELPSWYGIFVQESPGPVYYVHGLAHTTVKWGTTKSLDAFKNTVLPSCSPRVSTDGAAKCRNGLWQFQSDVIYVPDSTYEAETIIPNPACLHRTGIPSVDGPNGCFVPYLAYGDFPGGYLDTTLLDSPGTYNAATGAAYAQSLVQGINYEEYIYFHANKQPLAELDYRTVYALGQIGSRIGCSSTLCIFATDTTRRLAEEIIIPTQ
ncbi:MAG: hypothetical protein K0U59_10510, partial [Gammaproteobacteria bacterium]|nr:hypothetical protein [Gammaproteobacteria bacterium]